MGFVYKWTNHLNSKWYIGSHKGDGTDNYKAGGLAIKAAFKKYGMDNFSREIIHRCDEFKELEELILQTLEARQDPMSYNLTNLACGFDGRHTDETKEKCRIASTGVPSAMKGKKVSPEAKANMSKAQTGRKATDATKAKLSAMRAGDKHYNYGKKLSDATKLKISKTKLSQGGYNHQPVLDLETGISYDSFQEAYKATGRTGSTEYRWRIKGKPRFIPKTGISN